MRDSAIGATVSGHSSNRRTETRWPKRPRGCRCGRTGATRLPGSTVGGICRRTSGNRSPWNPSRASPQITQLSISSCCIGCSAIALQNLFDVRCGRIAFRGLFSGSFRAEREPHGPRPARPTSSPESAPLPASLPIRPSGRRAIGPKRRRQPGPEPTPWPADRLRRYRHGPLGAGYCVPSRPRRPPDHRSAARRRPPPPG